MLTKRQSEILDTARTEGTIRIGQLADDMTAATKRGFEIEIVSNNSILPRLDLISQGSSAVGSRRRGKSKKRFALTGLAPAMHLTKSALDNDRRSELEDVPADLVAAVMEARNA